MKMCGEPQFELQTDRPCLCFEKIVVRLTDWVSCKVCSNIPLGRHQHPPLDILDVCNCSADQPICWYLTNSHQLSLSEIFWINILQWRWSNCHMSASVYTGGGWRAHLCFSDPDAPSDISGDRYNGQILCSPPRRWNIIFTTHC